MSDKAIEAALMPAAWRVKDYADGWIFYTDEKRARVEAKIMNGALVEPLYSADALTSPASGERDALKPTAGMMGSIIPYLRPEVSIDEVRQKLTDAMSNWGFK